MSERDVIVAGGGPAGSAVARLLSLWGHSVTLLTRPSTRPPFAESLPPSCRKLFEPLGITQLVDAAGFVRTTGNTVWWGGSETRSHEFGGGERGYQVRRDVLDRLLLDAAEAAGVEVHREATVREILPTVRYDLAGGSRTAMAAWVVDATGRTGVLARQGYRQPAEGLRTLALVGAWEHSGGWDLEDPTHTLVESYESGWVWSVPLSPTLRHFAVMIDPARTPVGKKDVLDEAYREELERTIRFRAVLRGADVVAGPWATDASPYHFTRAGGPGVLLVGDAASFIDPLSSYGVKKALASAWLAAVVINSSLRDASVADPALAFYEAREREMYEVLTRQAVELAGEAGTAHEHGFWRDRASFAASGRGTEPDIAALRADPDVLAAFESIRHASAIRLRETPGLRRAGKPVVRDNRIILMPHLYAPAFPGGIRYIRGIDLAVLIEVAARHDQVPDLYDAYQRVAPPVGLPDFLGALSVAVGKGLMQQT